MKRVTEWHEQMQDASREIADWREEGMQQTDEHGDTFECAEWSDDDATFSDEEARPLPELPSLPPPPDVPTHIQTLTTAVQAFIHHLQKIYPPLIKRRLKYFPAPTRTSSPTVWPSPAQCEAFDALMVKAEHIPGGVDDLAAALFRWGVDGEDGVTGCISTIKYKAKELAGVMVECWDAEGKGRGKQKEDKVGEWVRQWADMLEEWEFEGMDGKEE